MAAMKWVVIILAMLNFGFMAFDGGRALVKGDYIRPASGAHAGQLGPWSKLAEKAGINPESGAMKTISLLWGISGIIITLCYAFSIEWSWKTILIFNILSLWYLFAGTISSLIQIVLLIIIRMMK